MKNYISHPKQIMEKALQSITCDVCKTEHEDGFEMQEFVCIKNRGGYGSVFGDGDVIEIDICQHCFKKTFEGKYRIIPEGEDEELES